MANPRATVLDDDLADVPAPSIGRRDRRPRPEDADRQESPPSVLGRIGATRTPLDRAGTDLRLSEARGQELKDYATRRTARINEAYERLRSARV